MTMRCATFVALAGAVACSDGDGMQPTTTFGLGSSPGSGAEDGGEDTDADTDGGTTGSTGGDMPMFTAGSPTTDPSATSGATTFTTTSPSTTADPTTSGENPTTSGGEPLPCDMAFSFEPPVPTLAQFFVETSHPEPLAYVSLTMEGPNVVQPQFLDVVAEDPWGWRFSVSGHQAGIYTLQFGNAPSEGGPVTVWSTCLLEISG
ncbi:MAG: hypothetical protein AAGA54_12025 [Myxococcota bacterium]